MKKILIMISVFLVFFVSGCAATQTIIPKDAKNKIHRVAVVSVIFEQLNFQGIGGTVLNNVYKRYPVPDWQLNKRAENIIVSNLRKNDNIEIIDINFDREKIKDIYKSRKNFPPELHDIKIIKSYLQDIAQSNNIDTLVILTDSGAEAHGGQAIYGATLFNRNIIGIEVNTSVYLAADIEVIDLQAMESIAKRLIYLEKPVDSSYWNSEPTKLKDEQLTFIRDTIYDALDTKLPQILKQFELVPPAKLNFSAATIEIEDKRTDVTKRELNIPFMSMPGMTDSINPELTDVHKKVITDEIESHLEKSDKKYHIVIQVTEGKKTFEATMSAEQEKVAFAIKLIIDDGVHTPHYWTSVGEAKQALTKFDAENSHVEELYRETIRTAIINAIDNINQVE